MGRFRWQSMYKKYKQSTKSTYFHCTHRQVDIGDPLLSRDLRKVEGEDEVDVVGRPAHHEDCHHHPEHLHLKVETCTVWPSGVVFLCSSTSLWHVTQLTLFEMHQHGRWYFIYCGEPNIEKRNRIQYYWTSKWKEKWNPTNLFFCCRLFRTAGWSMAEPEKFINLDFHMNTLEVIWIRWKQFSTACTNGDSPSCLSCSTLHAIASQRLRLPPKQEQTMALIFVFVWSSTQNRVTGQCPVHTAAKKTVSSTLLNLSKFSKIWVFFLCFSCFALTDSAFPWQKS